MLKKLLIANRGEIACRVAHSARRLGVRTVAVYSDADRGGAHVAACDEAVRIGEAPARDSYLNIGRIVAAARSVGADGVHPGYGFLSENHAFADACEAAGLVFVGPPSAAIAAMGDKARAKALMAAAGVPVLPGYHGDDQSAAHLQAEARRIGYPVIIKACAGGGGRGMRIVRSDEGFAAALESCRREAAAATGSEAVLVERYVEKPRHIEVQVFADRHGNCVHLFERDCSMQRRHQKVVEESPAPGLPVAMAEEMGRMAVRAARSVDYVGAGTVEFVVESGKDGRPASFYFMEMNTRLQVEHPVTELVTGLDLVEWQLRIAAGEPLPLRQEGICRRGHAIEARLCAERPEKRFFPSAGLLRHVEFPAAVRFAVPACPAESTIVRVDSGVRPGDEVTPHYDSMMAKVIAWAPDRAQAVEALRDALAATTITGVSTNLAFLGRLLDHERFRLGDVDTHLVEGNLDALVQAAPASAAA